MKLLRYIFHYKEIARIDKETNEELISYYPMIPCVFEWGGKKTRLVEGLLDSGSDGIVVPLDLVEYLELSIVSDDEPMRVVGREVERYTSKVNLILGRGGRYVNLNNVDVSAPKEGKTPILIGRNPIFKLYEITFREGEISGTITMKPQEEIVKKKKGKKHK